MLDPGQPRGGKALRCVEPINAFNHVIHGPHADFSFFLGPQVILGSPGWITWVGRNVATKNSYSLSQLTIIIHYGHYGLTEITNGNIVG